MIPKKLLALKKEKTCQDSMKTNSQPAANRSCSTLPSVPALEVPMVPSFLEKNRWHSRYLVGGFNTFEKY